MAQILTDLLEAGLIEKLDGSDERFARMEQAATVVAQELRAQPPLLIPAILAALAPDVAADDPAIAQAQRALVAEWKSMSSIHPSTPINLLRSILLDACMQAGEGKSAAILWLTAADTWPHARLGKEEACLRRAFEEISMRAEEVALGVPTQTMASLTAAVTVSAPSPFDVSPSPYSVDRNVLQQRVAASAGPHSQGQQQQQAGWNPQWAHSSPAWAWEFAPRMRDLLADELDALSRAVNGSFSSVLSKLNTAQESMTKSVGEALTSQEQRLKSLSAAMEQRQSLESSRLRTLWWAEAFYSPSLRRGYRELPPTVAAVVMAGDLLAQSTLPLPASVAYLLAETVHRLPGASFEECKPLGEYLKTLDSMRKQFPSDWSAGWRPAPSQGRLSLRDLVRLALGEYEWDLGESIRRAGLSADLKLSHPELARAVFRQEQAVRLAAGNK